MSTTNDGFGNFFFQQFTTATIAGNPIIKRNPGPTHPVSIFDQAITEITGFKKPIGYCYLKFVFLSHND